MKVTNLNNMVQIRKKKPKMKYNDKLVHKDAKERQVITTQAQKSLAMK